MAKCDKCGKVSTIPPDKYYANCPSTSCGGSLIVRPLKSGQKYIADDSNIDIVSADQVLYYHPTAGYFVIGDVVEYICGQPIYGVSRVTAPFQRLAKEFQLIADRLKSVEKSNADEEKKNKTLEHLQFLLKRKDDNLKELAVQGADLVNTKCELMQLKKEKERLAEEMAWERAEARKKAEECDSLRKKVESLSHCLKLCVKEKSTVEESNKVLEKEMSVLKKEKKHTDEEYLRKMKDVTAELKKQIHLLGGVEKQKADAEERLKELAEPLKEEIQLLKEEIEKSRGETVLLKTELQETLHECMELKADREESLKALEEREGDVTVLKGTIRVLLRDDPGTPTSSSICKNESQVRNSETPSRKRAIKGEHHQQTGKRKIAERNPLLLVPVQSRSDHTGPSVDSSYL